MKRKIIPIMFLLSVLCPALLNSTDAAPPKAEESALLKETWTPQMNSQIIKAWIGKKQSPATAAFTEEDLSPSMVRFRNNVLAAKTAVDLEKLMTQAEATYDKMDPDTQYFVAQILMLKP